MRKTAMGTADRKRANNFVPLACLVLSSPAIFDAATIKPMNGAEKVKSVEILYLSEQDVEDVGLTEDTILDLMEKALYEHGMKRIEMPPKPGVHPLKDTFIHAMPAYMPAYGACGIKWVSCFPDNVKKDLAQTTGLMIMNDPETGIAYAVMDCRWITAKRTAAVTAVSAKYLARKDTEVLGIIGAGVQGREHLLFCRKTLPRLKEVRIFDRRPEAVDSYVREMSPHVGVEIVSCRDPKDVVVGADMLVSATAILSAPAPFIKDEWLPREGLYLAPVDVDSVWEWETIRRMKFVTDDWGQTCHFGTVGCFPHGMPDLYAELGEIVCQKKPGREDDAENICNISIGMAIEDVICAKEIYEQAAAKGIGTTLKLY